MLLAGNPKEGKTTLSASVAVAVDQGVAFMGLRTKQTKVLWMGLEERGQDVARRFDALDNSTVLYHPGPFRANASSISELAAWVKANGVGLIIVDTLSKFWELKDENDAAGMERAVDPILRLARDSGAAILLLHHTRKSPSDDGSDIRGSSALFGSLDVGIIFRRASGADGGSRRTLKAFSRYSETPTHLDAERLDDGTWVRCAGGPAKAKLPEHIDELMAALGAELEDVAAIAKMVGIPYSTAKRGLDYLVENRPTVVRRTGVGIKGNPFKYGTVMLPPPDKPLDMVAESPARLEAEEIEARVDALSESERDRYYLILDRLDGPAADPATIKQQAWQEHQRP